MEESTSCRVCNNKKNNVSYLVKEMMYGLNESFEYYQCSNCNCLQIKDIIKNMSTYYPSDYYSFNKYNGQEFKGLKGLFISKRYKYTVFQKTFFEKLFLLMFRKKGYDIFKGLNISKNYKILDVGAGNGQHFLYPLSQIGFKNLLGCDPFIKKDINYNNGLTIKKSDVFKVTGKWDFITYHHSFEHLSNPLENLQKIKELLAPNGICIIRIPTVSSFAWENYKENWVQLDAPRHFYLHSKESMTILAEKTGMKLFNITYDSTYFQFSGSELYKKNISLSERKNPRVKKMWKKNRRLYSQKANILNKENNGDQAAFYLKLKA